jgi:hypothetical protein
MAYADMAYQCGRNIIHTDKDTPNERPSKKINHKAYGG